MMQMTMMSTKTTTTMMAMTTTTQMQTVEQKFKFLLMDLSHLPLQISKLFKIDTTAQQWCRQWWWAQRQRWQWWWQWWQWWQWPWCRLQKRNLNFYWRIWVICHCRAANYIKLTHLHNNHADNANVQKDNNNNNNNHYNDDNDPDRDCGREIEICIICRCEAVKYWKLMSPHDDDEDNDDKQQDHDDGDDNDDDDGHEPHTDCGRKIEI